MPTLWLPSRNCTSGTTSKSSSWSGWGTPGEKKNGTVLGVTGKSCKLGVKGWNSAGPLEFVVQHWCETHTHTQRWLSLCATSAHFPLRKSWRDLWLLDLYSLFTSFFWHTGTWEEEQLMSPKHEAHSQLHIVSGTQFLICLFQLLEMVKVL